MKLLVIDGNSILNRAFYAIRSLSTREGVFTGALYGFVNIFNKHFEEEKPDMAAVAFDRREPTFRHKKFAGYKAKRKGMPDELAMQLPLVKKWLDLRGIARLELAGYEADDIIGTLAAKCAAAGDDCVIVTGDRDALQLLDGRTSVKLARSASGKAESTLYTPEVFKSEYGFDPIRLIDYKAVCGDASDNIPGVAGIGDKGARALVCEFGGIEEIYKGAEDGAVKKSVAEKLEVSRAAAFESYFLAKIVKDAPIGAELSALAPKPCERAALLAFYEKYELTSLAKKLGEDGAAEPEEALTAPEARLLDDAAQARGFAEGRQRIALMLSNDGLYAFADGELALAGGPEAARALISCRAEKTVYDAKGIMRAFGEKLAATAFDVFIAGYMLNPSAAGYPLKELLLEALGERAETDAAAVCRLFELETAQRERLEKEGAAKLYYEVELPLCEVLYDMEEIGVALDAPLLEKFGESLAGEIAELQERIYFEAGGEFNISSPKQLGEVLFEKLGLPAAKKTKTGYSTDAKVLEKLKRYHPIAEDVLRYRMLTKLKSTYADGLLKAVDKEDGRLHSTFNQTVTQTGRISSTDPNLQNIPVRGELGREIRKMFVPAGGCVFLDADYSQIELRVLAAVSGDETMREAFLRGEDIHEDTAARVFRVDKSAVTDDLRRRAKAVNFGIVYGISDFSLADDIGVSKAEAAQYIRNYFDHYPKIKEYLERTVAEAKKNGFVTTAFGRRRYIPELASRNFNIRSFGERAAMNTPIQGAAADIIKIAMVKVSRALENSGLKARLVLQVHDELIVEAPEEESGAAAGIIKREMEAAADLTVPMLAEVGVGRSWYEAK